MRLSTYYSWGWGWFSPSQPRPPLPGESWPAISPPFVKNLASDRPDHEFSFLSSFFTSHPSDPFFPLRLPPLLFSQLASARGVKHPPKGPRVQLPVGVAAAAAQMQAMHMGAPPGGAGGGGGWGLAGGGGSGSGSETERGGSSGGAPPAKFPRTGLGRLLRLGGAPPPLLPLLLLLLSGRGWTPSTWPLSRGPTWRSTSSPGMRSSRPPSSRSGRSTYVYTPEGGTSIWLGGCPGLG